MYDRLCPEGHQMIDCWEPVTPPAVPCSACGAATTRAWLQRASAVIGDDIPGGMVLEHVEPGRKVYSNSELRRVLKQRGYQQHVEHVTLPGTDKSKHTTRWV